MMKYVVILFVLIGKGAFASTPSDYLDTMLEPEQVREDIEQWLQFLDKTHPQLSLRVEQVDRFYRDVNRLQASIDKPISIGDFWRRISTFNSVLNDGHTSINIARMKTLANQHVKSGGGLFPYDVVIESDRLFIKSKVTGDTTPFIGDEIVSINGVKTGDFLKPLVVRTNGDTEAFRRALLQRRFAQYVWLYYGNLDSFDLKLKSNGIEFDQVAPANRIEVDLDKVFEEQFNYEVLDVKNGLLTIKTFSWGSEYQKVIDFLHTVFAQVNASGIEHLIIDIRENGGGDDGIWIDGILPYLADKNWRTGSRYKVKVIESRVKEGQTAGEVIEGQNSFRAVRTDVDPFKGQVSVLLSDYTYSSSILFANVIQDHQFGQIVGEKSGARTNQTGGIQVETLKHSQLRVVSPRFYLQRPRGATSKSKVVPDVIISYDKTEPRQLVDKLISRSAAKHSKGNQSD